MIGIADLFAMTRFTYRASRVRDSMHRRDQAATLLMTDGVGGRRINLGPRGPRVLYPTQAREVVERGLQLLYVLHTQARGKATGGSSDASGPAVVWSAEKVRLELGGEPMRQDVMATGASHTARMPSRESVFVPIQRRRDRARGGCMRVRDPCRIGGRVAVNAVRGRIVSASIPRVQTYSDGVTGKTDRRKKVPM